MRNLGTIFILSLLLSACSCLTPEPPKKETKWKVDWNKLDYTCDKDELKDRVNESRGIKKKQLDFGACAEDDLINRTCK